MTRKDVARRVAARRRLHETAAAVASIHGGLKLERLVREAHPELVALVGERELEAIVEVVTGPLAS